jgi:hypothetical protein
LRCHGEPQFVQGGSCCIMGHKADLVQSRLGHMPGFSS